MFKPYRSEKIKRCHNYSDDGVELFPCSHGSRCFFAHPDDPEWDRLKPTGNKYDYRKPVRRVSRSRSPPRRSSPNHRDHRSTGGRSPLPSPPRRRYNTSRDRSPPPRRRLSRSPPRGPRSPYSERGRNRASSVTSSRPRSPPRSERFSRPPPPSASLSDVFNLNPPSPQPPPAGPSTVSAPLPGFVPASDKPLLPPPPPPSAPAKMSLNISPASIAQMPAMPSISSLRPVTIPSETLQPETTKTRWKKLMDLVTKWVSQAKDLQGTKDRLETLHQIAKINPLLGLSVNEANQLEEVVRQKEAVLNEILVSIINAPEWPSAPRTMPDGIANESETMSRHLGELEIQIAGLQKVVEDSRLEIMEELGLEEKFVDGMRPLKRKRTNDGSAAPVDREEGEKIRQRMDVLEDDIDTIRNTLNQHDEDFKAEIEQMFEERIADVEAARRSPNDPEVKWRKATTARLDKLQESMRTVSQETHDLLARAKNVDTEMSTIAQKTQEESHFNQALLARIEKLEKDAEADRQELKNFHTSLEMYSRNMQQQTPRIDAAAVEAFFQDNVRPKIHELCVMEYGGLRAELAKMIQTSQEEVYANTWEKLAVTNQVIDAVCQRLGITG
ncbi:hypothetical protein CYLTODRAFT_487683, partial [Cylindrobasidium torrendii FP15055 ss-10]